MDKVLNWISARMLISEFLEWAENEKGESFSHAIFRRAKIADDNELTDRQKLMIELADEFVSIKKNKALVSALPV